jgi:hypothetical protein
MIYIFWVFIRFRGPTVPEHQERRSCLFRQKVFAESDLLTISRVCDENNLLRHGHKLGAVVRGVFVGAAADADPAQEVVEHSKCEAVVVGVGGAKGLAYGRQLSRLGPAARVGGKSRICRDGSGSEGPRREVGAAQAVVKVVDENLKCNIMI